jgi:hypothetical protein
VWKLIFDSVVGTSHRVRAEECQDSHLALVTRVSGEDVLVAACADGAGSAPHSSIGSKLACERVVAIAVAALDRKLAVAEIDRGIVQAWYREVRDALSDEALRMEVDVADLATTLLVSVVGDEASAFAQVGDGAIVVGAKDGYGTVFWPEQGEYANITTFLTSAGFEEQIAFDRRDRCDEVAMLTDGLQRLALDFNAQTAHGPFFKGMFDALKSAATHEDLFAPLRSFLSSSSVNDRTDDDKTIILATRKTDAGAS